MLYVICYMLCVICYMLSGICHMLYVISSVVDTISYKNRLSYIMLYDVYVIGYQCGILIEVWSMEGSTIIRNWSTKGSKISTLMSQIGPLSVQDVHVSYPVSWRIKVPKTFIFLWKNNNFMNVCRRMSMYGYVGI